MSNLRTLGITPARIEAALKVAAAEHAACCESEKEWEPFYANVVYRELQASHKQEFHAVDMGPTVGYGADDEAYADIMEAQQ